MAGNYDARAIVYVLDKHQCLLRKDTTASTHINLDPQPEEEKQAKQPHEGGALKAHGKQVSTSFLRSLYIVQLCCICVTRVRAVWSPKELFEHCGLQGTFASQMSGQLLHSLASCLAKPAFTLSSRCLSKSGVYATLDKPRVLRRQPSHCLHKSGV